MRLVRGVVRLSLPYFPFRLAPNVFLPPIIVFICFTTDFETPAIDVMFLWDCFINPCGSLNFLGNPYEALPGYLEVITLWFGWPLIYDSKTSKSNLFNNDSNLMVIFTMKTFDSQFFFILWLTKTIFITIRLGWWVTLLLVK